MQFDQLKSGILVPHEPHEPPKPAVKTPPIEYGPIEIRDPEKREATYKALGKVWVASGLNYYGAINYTAGDTREAHEARQEAFHQFAQALLGNDYHGFEELC